MQEEIENRVVNLAITTTRLSSQALIQGWRAYQALGKMDKELQEKVKAQQQGQGGRMSVKELVKQDQGVSSLDIGKTNIKDFERIAQKYGIDYAIVKDKNFDPPHYTVFFKAKETDAMTAAFSEYTAQVMHQSKRPSLRKALRKFRQMVASIPNVVRNKDRGRER